MSLTYCKSRRTSGDVVLLEGCPPRIVDQWAESFPDVSR